MKLPLTAFVYSLEMFVKTMRGLQGFADQGIDAMTSGVVIFLGDGANNENDPIDGLPASEMTQAAGHTPSSQGDLTDEEDETNLKEERKMPDTDLSDDMLKLVRYKILFIKRDYEVAFQEVEEIVHDNLAGTAFTGWKIAEFIQNLDTVTVPFKWRKQHYPRDVGDDKDAKVLKLPEEDKKYLRVYYEVLDRYVREEFKYEEDQIDVLKEIRDELKKRQPARASDGGGSAGSGGGAGQTGGVAGGGRGIGG